MEAQGKLIRLSVASSHLDDFLARFSANVRGSREEPGCRQFRFARCREEEGPDGRAIFYVWEEFIDAAALAHHQQTPHFVAFRTWLADQGDAVVRTGLMTEPLEPVAAG